jgi:hypothetical protein
VERTAADVIDGKGKVKKLRTTAEEMELETGGKRIDLIDRIRAHREASQQPASDTTYLPPYRPKLEDPVPTVATVAPAPQSAAQIAARRQLAENHYTVISTHVEKGDEAAVAAAVERAREVAVDGEVVSAALSLKKLVWRDLQAPEDGAPGLPAGQRLAEEVATLVAVQPNAPTEVADTRTVQELRAECAGVGLKAPTVKASLEAARAAAGVDPAASDGPVKAELADRTELLVLLERHEQEDLPYDDYTVTVLRNLCQERGLKSGGKKAELVERLKSDDKGDDKVDHPLSMASKNRKKEKKEEKYDIFKFNQVGPTRARTPLPPGGLSASRRAEWELRDVLSRNPLARLLPGPMGKISAARGRDQRAAHRCPGSAERLAGSGARALLPVPPPRSAEVAGRHDAAEEAAELGH